MRIAATADIHYDLLSSREDLHEFDRFVQSLADADPDVFLVGGDTVGLGWETLPECLNRFEKIGREKLIVFGNHDHWSADKRTSQHLRRLEEIIRKSSFHLLDHGPKIIGNVGFAGNCCWYDYTFARHPAPAESSFEQKSFRGHVIWNDANFVRLPRGDRDYSERLLLRLEDDIRRLESKAESLIVLTHHVGFREMAVRKPEQPEWNFANAFIGTEKLGKMLLRHRKVLFHLCGHTHQEARVEKAQLVSINIGSTYRKKRFVIIDIPD